MSLLILCVVVCGVPYAGPGVAQGTDSAVAPVLQSGDQSRPRLVLGAERLAMRDMEYSPDGKTIAIAGGNGVMWLCAVSTGRRIHTLTGCGQTVSFSPDGSSIASGTNNGAVGLWDSVSGEVSRTFSGAKNVEGPVIISPDGKAIAAVTADNTVTLWRMADGKQTFILSGHKDELRSIAFSPDGARITSAGRGGDVKVWSVTTGKQMKSRQLQADAAVDPRLRGDTQVKFTVAAVAYSPDGKMIACQCSDRTVRLLDASSGDEIKRIALPLMGNARDEADKLTLATRGRKIRFTKNGGSLAATGFLYVWLLDLTAGDVPKGCVAASQGGAFCLSPDGESLAYGQLSAVWCRRIASWDRLPDIVAVHNQGSGVFAFSGDGRYMATATAQSVKLWDMSSGFPRQAPFRSLAGYPRSLMLNRTSSVLAAWDGQAVSLWDLPSLEESGTVSGPCEKHIAGSAVPVISQDGAVMAVPGDCGSVRLWDLSTGQLLKDLPVCPESDGMRTTKVEFVHFGTGGTTLVTNGYDADSFLIDGVATTVHLPHLKIWSIPSYQAQVIGRDLSTKEGKALLSTLRCGTVSPDGRMLVVAVQWVSDGAFVEGLVSFDIENATLLKRARTDHQDVSLCFSPDGRTIATGGTDGRIRVRDSKTFALMQTLSDHSDWVESVAYARDGNTLASTSSDGTTKLWRMPSGKLIATLVDLSPDDWVVVTPDGRWDGTVVGGQALHWVVNNKPVAVDQFFEAFYTPGLLARALGGQELPPIGIAPISQGFAFPPFVDITSPRSGDKFKSEKREIAVQAGDQGGGIKEIRLYQNGRLVGSVVPPTGSTQPGISSRRTTTTFQAVLLPGNNEFSAVALNKDLVESAPSRITVEYEAEKTAGDLYVLSVGINRYTDSRFDLNYARADAQCLADALARHGAGVFKNVLAKTLMDGDATKTHIASAVTDIAASCRPEDTFVFFYSGHGCMDPGRKAYYLALSDVSRISGADGLAEKGLSSEDLSELCRQTRAQKVLVMLDCCESGAALSDFAQSGFRLPEYREVVQGQTMARLARRDGMTVMAACRRTQTAKETSKLGHGVFTNSLLDGLGGKADRNADGTITAGELFSYVPGASGQTPVGLSCGQDFSLASVASGG